MRNREDAIEQLIRGALVATLFVRPRDPGLTDEEILEVGRMAGYEPGEIRDGISRVIPARRWDDPKLMLEQGSSFMGISDFNFEWPNEPRQVKAFEITRRELQGLARAEGAAASIDRDALVARCVPHGVRAEDADVAIAGLAFDGILQIHDNQVSHTPGKHTWVLPSEQLASREKHDIGFTPNVRVGQVLPFVREVIAHRGDEKRAAEAVAVSSLPRVPGRNAHPNKVPRMISTADPDPKKVFIIHGRNTAARIAVEHFLKVLKLEPLDFDELAADMGTEFVGNIVLEGLKRARGIVTLFTPDEFAALLPAFRGVHDAETDTKRWQARPNVIFEAGIAFGIARERSILVTLGAEVTLFSDVTGIHLLRLNNTVESRGKFRQKLIGMGCDVDQRTNAWTDMAQSGDFETCLNPLSGVSARDPFP